MKIIYLACPVRGSTLRETDDNVKRAIRWYEYVMRRFPEVAVEASWILSCMTFDDGRPEDRERGRTAGVALLLRCDEIWLCGGRMSEGMLHESKIMRDLGKPVRGFVAFDGATKLDEPPVIRVEPVEICLVS